MRSSSQRKHLRYYFVKPASDRRLEQRFESREDVAIRIPATGKIRRGVAGDIGRMGLRLETEEVMEMGDAIELVFPHSSDGVRCFGRVVWSRRLPGSRCAESGVAIEAWLGVILGENSWLRFKGAHLKKDRRSSPR